MKKESFDEKVGWGRMLLVGFQHVLTMCPGTIAVPLILAGALGLDEKETAFLVSANFFTSGIAILIQVLGIGKLAGSRYPIVLGSSFAPLSPMILIGKEYGMAALFGSVIASGAVIFLLSFFMDKILKLFPQVVVGTFVTLIGITLAPTALRDLAGGEGNAGFGSVENLILGLAVLIFILLVEKYGKGIWKRHLEKYVIASWYYRRNGCRMFFTYGGYCFHCAGRDIPAGSAFCLWSAGI